MYYDYKCNFIGGLLFRNIRLKQESNRQGPRRQGGSLRLSIFALF